MTTTLVKNLSEIKGFEDFTSYIICSDGKLINTKTNKFLNGSKKNKEYITYSIHSSNTKKQMTIECHKLVALAFVDGYFDGCCIDHVDRNKFNNDYTNLRFVTYSENQRNKTNRSHKDMVVVSECLQTGQKQTHDSISDAAKKLNLNYDGIYKCFIGTRLTTQGYKFYFAK